MNYLNLFKEKNIVLNLKATDKRSGIEEMVDFAIAADLLAKTKKKAVIEALMAREKLGSTGLGRGVAIPHVKIEGFSGDLALMARSSSGVEFNSIDGEAVYILFLIVSPAKDAEKHLSILQWISGLARNQDFNNFIRGASDEKEIVGILKEMSG